MKVYVIHVTGPDRNYVVPGGYFVMRQAEEIAEHMKTMEGLDTWVREITVR